MNTTTGTNATSLWLELAAALLVPSAVIGFIRVFAEPRAVIPIIGASLLSSAVAVVGRRIGLPLLVTAAGSFVLLGLLIVNAYAPGTASAGIVPTGATLAGLQGLIDDLVGNFQSQQSPVPTLNSFIATSMVAAWVMALLTDWGAMRLRLAFEPIFPSALIFIFTAIPPISASQNRILATAAFALGLANWAVAQRLAKMVERTVWLPAHERLGPSILARGALIFSALAIAGGVVVGPRLPWAEAEPVYSFAKQRDPVRKVTSPFVEISKRLVNQTDQVMFTVESEESSYWRIAGLDQYVGNSWRVEGDFSPEDGDLPGQNLGGKRRELSQRIEVRSLAAIWLPAAFTPARIEETSADLTWNSESSSLTVSNDIDTSDGVIYEITSSLPDFTVEDLRAAPNTVPDDIAQRFLDLPDDLTPRVAEEAQRITAGQPTVFDQMIALQNHFRAFDYSINLDPLTEGVDPIDAFLNQRVGFCQQFSGTFALMARSLGVPTRVATGFTWGDPQTTEDGRTVYTVTGRHAHAWPEVYFDGLGWVAFEPTPGRGLPGADSYTGVTPRQDSIIEENIVPEQQPEEDLTVPEIPPADAEPPTPEDAPPPEPETNAAEVPETEPDEGSSFPDIPWRPLAVVALLASYPAAVLIGRHLRQSKRRNAASSPADRVAVAWAEACEEYELTVKTRRAPSETRTEFAGRLVDQGVVASSDMQRLAELATAARFSVTGVDETSAQHGDELSASVTTSVAALASKSSRLARILDPRRIVARRAPRQTITEGRDGQRPDRDGELIEVGGAAGIAD